MKNIIVIITLMLLCAVGCKKEKIAEIDKLPAATQTGANTFGCLVNGKAWVAQRNDCNFFCDASFKVIYDGGNGGNLGITGLFINLQEGINQGILLGFDSTNFKSQFIYNQNHASAIGFTFIDNSQYTRSWDSLVSCTGSINLTAYNLQTGIVSGTFEFTLVKPNSEAIIVTNGRFDKKL